MSDSQPTDTYPAYARSERIADGVIHGLAVTLAITGTVLLTTYAALEASGGTVAALSIYGGALIFSFLASSAYHFTPWERLRAPLRRLDHAAIYLKIAGTYTPLVVMIGSAFAYAVLAVVWTLAVLGMVAKLFFWKTPGHWGTALYLLLGWASVTLIWSLAPILPITATVLIAVGGLLYSAGTVFFSWESLKFANAIWHGFVLAASGCFFAAISLGVFAA